MINRVINYNKIKRTDNVNSKIKYYSIPFVGQSSLIIRKILRSLNPNNCILSSNYAIYQHFFSKIEDSHSLTPKKKSGVVFKVPCSDSPFVYVGETSQLLQKGISQRKNDVKDENGHTFWQITSTTFCITSILKVLLFAVTIGMTRNAKF